MKVLVVVERSPDETRRYLVNIYTKALIDEVRRLIGNKRHSKAVVTALSKGDFEKELTDSEATTANADLVLSERSAYWDLTGKKE